MLLVAPAAWSQTAGSSPAVVATCILEADEEAYGLAELEQECPGIEHALVELGYAPFISEEQMDQLTRVSLLDLQQLADRYRESAQTAEVKVESLTPILGSLEEQQRAEAPLTWFGRLKKWLRERFLKQEDASESWLSRWLDEVSVPEAISRAILYGLIILVNVLAIAVLINELRAAGWLRRRMQTAGGTMPAVASAAGPVELTLADLDAASLRDRSSILLRLLVTTLVKSGRLRTERSLTHRELATRAAFDDDEQRLRFRRVATLSERTIYGDGRVSEDEVDRVVQEGRALMTQLGAAK